MEINVGMLIFLLSILVGFSFIYLITKGKYIDFIAPLDEKEFRMKQLMPAAFWILDLVQYKFNTAYDRQILNKTAEIYGSKYAQYYLRIHWANKIAVLLVGILMIALIGAGAGPDVSVAVFGILVLGGLLYFTDYELNEKLKKRRFQLQIDFPDFLNKLTLLINAGMTVHRAWEKIVKDNRKKCPLYDELEMVLTDIIAGVPEYKAYENFAKKCRTPEITKFVSVTIQNLKKGNTEMVSILRLQAASCWEMRKNAAKRLGEEASTKLVFPMMIMFIAILIIVAMPAILAMQGI